MNQLSMNAKTFLGVAASLALAGGMTYYQSVKNAPGTGGIFDHEKPEAAHKVMDDSNRKRRAAQIAAYEKQFEDAAAAETVPKKE